MFHLFEKGGPIMWPLLITSFVAIATTIERLIFMARERKRHSPETVSKMLAHVEQGKIKEAIEIGSTCEDFVAKTLHYGLAHHQGSLTNALIQQANRELKRFNHGLPILDTIITLAPLLGLLGTVTGMIRAFGLLGNSELDAPQAITGGIAEALIATAFGLGIAIIALIPFNYLTTRLEEARHEIEDASTHLELCMLKKGKSA